MNKPPFLDLPDPEPLEYNFFLEFTQDAPAFHIQLNTPTHTLLQIAIPFDILEVMYAHTLYPNQSCYRRPTFGPQTLLTPAEVKSLHDSTIQATNDAIKRTLDVYHLL